MTSVGGRAVHGPARAARAVAAAVGPRAAVRGAIRGTGIAALLWVAAACAGDDGVTQGSAAAPAAAPAAESDGAAQRPQGDAEATPEPPPGPATVHLAPLLDGRPFARPVQVGTVGSTHFVAQLDGVVTLFDALGEFSAPLVDLRGTVHYAEGDEDGLLGIAFDPAFRENGYVYLYWSLAGPRRTVLSRFTAVGAEVDPASRLDLLEVPQSLPDHRGGGLAFGPDGMLYLGVGDGGVEARGQDRGDLHGSVVRLDVSGATAERPYAVPPDNPFVDEPGVRPEIWAYGFRNPWRLDIDPATGAAWVADVGEQEWEEINILRPGGNYGWALREGDHCYPPAAACAELPGAVAPVLEYAHGDGGCAVIGGVVYRGEALAVPEGAFVFGDFCSGDIWFTPPGGGERTLLATSEWALAGFGRGLNGEVWVAVFDGPLLALQPGDPPAADAP